MHPDSKAKAQCPTPPACFAKRSIDGAASSLKEDLLTVYSWMYLSRRTDDRLRDLFRQGKVYGTLTGGQGNEGLVVPVALLADKSQDVISFSHRGLGGHLIWSDHLCDHLCQYMANSGSPTLGREGNIHHGDPEHRSIPMISHLGSAISNVMGAADSQRRKGRQAIGICFIGDGASSTGDIHETMNMAALLKVPMVFIIENNEYAYSTPVNEQYRVDALYKRAAGYGMEGSCIDVSDTADLLEQMGEVFDAVRQSGMPRVVEVKTLRLRGHAAYDTCDYLKPEVIEGWEKRDPLPALRERMLQEHGEVSLAAVENEADAFLEASIAWSLPQAPVDPEGLADDCFSEAVTNVDWSTDTASCGVVTFAQAINLALRKVLADSDKSIIMGQDIADYGGAFKVTDGLLADFGRARVLNTPLCESAMIGYATGLALNGHRPIVEFQFADFATEATTQIVMNAATMHFRSGAKVPWVLRFPTGGGLTFGSFHSQDLEAFYLQFPGLKVLYPSTPQDAFDAVLAAYESDDPVLLFEHKGLYRRAKAEVAFHKDYTRVWKPRQIMEGSVATVLTYGEMSSYCEQACRYLEDEYEYSFDLFDLRSLRPLDLEPFRASLAKTGRLAVVHEGRRHVGFGAELVSELLEQHFFDLEAPPLRIASMDIPVPFAASLEQAYRPSVDGITQQLLDWIEQ